MFLPFFTACSNEGQSTAKPKPGLTPIHETLTPRDRQSADATTVPATPQPTSDPIRGDDLAGKTFPPTGPSTNGDDSGKSPSGSADCIDTTAFDCAVAAKVLALTNEYRRQNNRPALLPHPQVAWLAHYWSIEQGKRGVASHDGWRSGLYARVFPQKFNSALPRLTAENAGHSQRPEDVDTLAFAMFRMWRDSPPHRENMLGDATYLGVGVAKSTPTAYAGVFNWYGTQIFL